MYNQLLMLVRNNHEWLKRVAYWATGALSPVPQCLNEGMGRAVREGGTQAKEHQHAQIDGVQGEGSLTLRWLPKSPRNRWMRQGWDGLRLIILSFTFIYIHLQFCLSGSWKGQFLDETLQGGTCGDGSKPIAVFGGNKYPFTSYFEGYLGCQGFDS